MRAFAKRDIALSMYFPGPLRDQLHHSRFFAEMASASEIRRIGVLGCHRGAGVSTVALNIASMLRQRTGESTLLAETNVRNPVYGTRWKLGTPGTFNRLIEPGNTAVEPDRLADGTDLFAARFEPEPLGLLRLGLPKLMNAFLTYRHVVLDLPAVLDKPDATILAPAMDVAILVLEAEKTRWQVAKQTCEVLDSAGLRVMGVILNKRPAYIPDWLYRLL